MLKKLLVTTLKITTNIPFTNRILSIVENQNEHIFLKKPEVAELLRCSIGTVDNLIKQGKIHTYGFNRRVIFKKQEIIDSLIRR